MTYRIPTDQPSAKRLAEAVGRVEAGQYTQTDLPMYNAFAASMNRYVETIFRPLLDSNGLIDVVERRNEWHNQLMEAGTQRVVARKRVISDIRNDVGDGIPFRARPYWSPGIEGADKSEIEAAKNEQPTLGQYWSSLSRESIEAESELAFLKEFDPAAYKKCMDLYIERLSETPFSAQYLRIFSRSVTTATSPLLHLQPPAEKSPRLMEYWKGLRLKRETYVEAGRLAREALQHIDERVYQGMLNTTLPFDGVTTEDKLLREQEKQEYKRIAKQDGLHELVADLEYLDDQDRVDKIIKTETRRLTRPVTRAIAAPLDVEDVVSEPRSVEG